MLQAIVVLISLISAVMSGLPAKCFPPPNASFEECCPLNVELIPKATIDKCLAAFPVPPPPPTPGGPPRGCCMSECIMKELKFLVDGKLDRSVVTAYLVEKTKSNPALKPIVEGAIDTCIAKGEEKKKEFDEGAKLPPLPGQTQTCNMISGFMIGCVHAQIYLKCPVALGTKQECQDMTEFAKECGFIIPMKKPM